MLPKITIAFFTAVAMVLTCSQVWAQGPSSSASGQTMSSGASADQPSDSTLTREVENALTHDPMMGASRIHVKTEDRMVTLSGTVSSKQAARRAEQIASSVNGVKGVEDYIHYGRH